MKTLFCIISAVLILLPAALSAQQSQSYVHAYLKCRPRYFADDYKVRISMSDKATADSLRKMLYDTLDAFYGFVQVLDIMSTFGYEVVYEEKYKTLFESFITWATVGIIDTYAGRIYLFRKPRNGEELRK